MTYLEPQISKFLIHQIVSRLYLYVENYLTDRNLCTWLDMLPKFQAVSNYKSTSLHSPLS
jgi:hypothetical protein